MKTEIVGVQGQRSQKDLAPKDQKASEKNGAGLAELYSKIVEQYAMCFDRPEDRLRFLNNTIIRQKKRQEHLYHSLRYLRFLENTRIYDWILEGRLSHSILEELTTLARQLPANRQAPLLKIEVPLSARLFFFIQEARHAIYATGLIMSGVALVGLYLIVSWVAGIANGMFIPQKDLAVIPPNGQGNDTAPAATPAPIKALPKYRPDKVFPVEDTADYEYWSNGCRILKKYETDNYPRSYYAFLRGSDTDDGELRHDIVGIVYHTSESHIVDFVESNKNEIRKKSIGLLEYIRKEKSYNYLIDRVGKIYRIVRDNQTAHHAGESIWSDSKYTYVVLNHSFIGICFESTVNAETLEDTLTEAQITEGYRLTNVLRTKYNIEDINCTTHGLVSVKPEKALIAYHHDWVKNFPFELMGLSDKYKIQPPNIAEYGFTYDSETLEKLGNKLWEGAELAEKEFRKRAEQAHIDPDLLRIQLRDRYFAQRDKARRLRPQQNGAGNPTLAAKTPAESSSAESGNN